MGLQQEHLPQEKPATSEQEWGFTIEQFVSDNWGYLVIILIILVIFFYARYSWTKRNKR